MIGHTDSYETFKRSMQQQLDFVVLVCYAVPVLKRAIAATGETTQSIPLDPPDHFAARNLFTPQLVQFSKEYEHELARALVLTSFSYFEAYIKAVVREMLAFHGGPDAFLKLAVKRSRRSLTPLPHPLNKAKRKLQEPHNAGKTAKYQVYSTQLAASGFRFPTELVTAYGVERLIEKVGKDKRLEMKAHEIPSLLVNAFQMDSFAKHAKEFDETRDLRNALAHGQRHNIALNRAIEAGRNLRKWATSIDAHFVEHFLVVERYA
jgi:hypothetical protein